MPHHAINLLHLGEFTIATFLARHDMRNIGVLLRHHPSETVLCIDAPHAPTIMHVAQQLGWHIHHLLITHHHWDHVEGILELKTAYNCTVYGRDHPKIAPIDVVLVEGQDIRIPTLRSDVNEQSEARSVEEFEGEHPQSDNHIQLQTICATGHCNTQIAYYIPKIDCAFVADALFNLGCGRILQGTHAEAFATFQRIKTLPPHTRLWFGHDYYAPNAKVSLIFAPDDAEILAYMEQMEARTQAMPCPIMLQHEAAANLFMRAATVEEFTALRVRRDRF